MDKKPVLLIAADREEDARELALQLDGLCTELRPVGTSGIAAALSQEVDLTLLYVRESGDSVLPLCCTVRELTNSPLLLLGKLESAAVCAALQVGADDCIAWPCPLPELEARVTAHLRREDKRRCPPDSAVVQCGPFVLCPQLYSAKLEGRCLDLTVHEFHLLLLFCRNPGRVLSKEQIYAAVWNSDYGDIGTVAVYVKRLRDKLGRDHTYIQTVWGRGYQFLCP